MRIAAFTKYDREAASTRQRVLQYLPALINAGFEVDYHPLLDDSYVRSLGTGQTFPRWRVAQAYGQRLAQLIAGTDSDIIWVYAELFPKLPAAFERLAFRSRKPVVYDFDDAFFVPYDEHPSVIVRALLGGKLEPLISGAAAVCCGNDYLRSYASRLNDRCIVLPTVVDTSIYRPLPRDRSPPLTIGWIGSPSTWVNVRPLLPMLERVCREHDVRFRAIGAGWAAQRDRLDGFDLVEWRESSEIAEVQSMDIGIMPLLNQPFQRGKSGYKLIQYLACGLPVVASPVGVNSDIVTEGDNGFLANSPSEWESALVRLIGDRELRRRMGSHGRAIVEARYSLSVHAPRLIATFRNLVADASE